MNEDKKITRRPCSLSERAWQIIDDLAMDGDWCAVIESLALEQAPEPLHVVAYNVVDGGPPASDTQPSAPESVTDEDWG